MARQLLDLPTDLLLAIAARLPLRARLRSLAPVCSRLAALIPLSIRSLKLRCALSTFVQRHPTLLTSLVNLREISLPKPGDESIESPHLAYLGTRVTSLYIGDYFRTLDAPFASFSRLTALSLDSVALSAQSAIDIIRRNSDTLTQLHVADYRETDGWELPPLPALRSFTLAQAQASIAPLLVPMTSLTELELEFVAGEGDEIERVRLPHLTRLLAWENGDVRTGINAHGAKWLTALTTLRHLDLQCPCKAPDAAFYTFVATLPSLVELTLCSQLSDTHCGPLVQSLLPHTKLRKLDVYAAPEGLIAVTGAIGSRLASLGATLLSLPPAHLSAVFANCSSLTELTLPTNAHSALVQSRAPLPRLRKLAYIDRVSFHQGIQLMSELLNLFASLRKISVNHKHPKGPRNARSERDKESAALLAQMVQNARNPDREVSYLVLDFGALPPTLSRAAMHWRFPYLVLKGQQAP